MDSLTEATVSILDRNPALALSLEQVRDLLERDRPGVAIPAESILSALRGSQEAVHILPHPKRRWAHAVGPRAWILVPRSPGEPGGGRGIRSKLRSTLAALGRSVEPGSIRGWARWTRMLEEEAQLQKALRRRSESGAVSEKVAGAGRSPL